MRVVAAALCANSVARGGRVDFLIFSDLFLRWPVRNCQAKENSSASSSLASSVIYVIAVLCRETTKRNVLTFGWSAGSYAAC